MRQVIALKRAAEQVLALAEAVHFERGVDRHHVFHEIEIAKRHARLQRVRGDAAIRAKHVVHIDFVDALLRFLLEFLFVRREIRVLIAEQLVRNLAREQHADVRVLMDVLAHQIHADARANRRDIVGLQNPDDVAQRADNLLRSHHDLSVIGAQIVRNLLGILEVDCVADHADGVGANRVRQILVCNGANQRAVEAAAEQKAERNVRVQALDHAERQLLVDLLADRVDLIFRIRLDARQVRILNELAVLPVVPRRERFDRVAQPNEVLRLAGEEHLSVRVEPVEQRANPNRVARGNQRVALMIVKDQRILRVQHLEHIRPVTLIHGQEQLAIRAALEVISGK